MTWTRDIVFDALAEAEFPPECKFEVFVQGSFANNTHISTMGDVDIVVMMTLPIEENIKDLNGRGRQNFNKRYEASNYNWRKFRADLIEAARRRYFISEGKRCLDIKHWDSMIRVPVDVLPAIEYRLYQSFDAPGLEEYEEGVYFRHRNGSIIINYPKQHLVNGCRKELATNGRSKSAVRAVKNARDCIVKCENFEQGERERMAGIPSYYLECLMYNVPSQVFRGALPEMMCNVTSWLVELSNSSAWSALKCQNKIVDLFGDGPDQWGTRAARETAQSLQKFFCEAAR